MNEPSYASKAISVFALCLWAASIVVLGALWEWSAAMFVGGLHLFLLILESGRRQLERGGL